MMTTGIGRLLTSCWYFKMLHQDAHGYSCAGKHRSPAKNLGVSFHEFVDHCDLRSRAFRSPFQPITRSRSSPLLPQHIPSQFSRYATPGPLSMNSPAIGLDFGSVLLPSEPYCPEGKKQSHGTVRQRRETKSLIERSRSFVLGVDDHRMHRHAVTHRDDSLDRVGEKQLTHADSMARLIDRQPTDQGARHGMAWQPSRQPIG